MPIPSMNELFTQLGLESDDQSIDRFIRANQLPDGVRISDAPFWTDAQRQFIAEQFIADAAWILVIDQLNEQLHEDAMQQQQKNL